MALEGIMNRDIVIGFVKEHEEICLHHTLAKAIREKRPCSFCQNVNRDCLLLITRMREARKTLDVGLALSPDSRPEHYTPYENAGFSLFAQREGTQSERIGTVFHAAFERGYENAILIAHGAPNLPLDHLECALSELRDGRGIILGPTLNGKFHLVGMSRSKYSHLHDHPLFGEIDFDSSGDRDRIIERVREVFSSCTVLPEWYAVKTVKDLKRMHRDSLNGRGWRAHWTTCLVDDII
jgi:glycosyltransferase A (GT-A) superfamily protein (DUF2064 family)